MNEDLINDAFEPKSEYDFFKARRLGQIYVSKALPFRTYFPSPVQEKRRIKKVFENSEITEFVEVAGEILLRCSKKERSQVSVIAYVRKDELSSMSFTLQKFTNNKNGFTPVQDTSFNFSQAEFIQLLKFLNQIKLIDFKDKKRFVVNEEELDGWPITISFNNLIKTPKTDNEQDLEVESLLRLLKGQDKEKLLSLLKNQNLSKEDIDILAGRRESVELFKNKLFENKSWNEKDWQKFFEENDWILGYGLDYRFLNIIQREASISSSDLDGRNEVITDFLMGDHRFTVLVELKKPDTQLFEATQNRSQSWKLSKDLMNAVSQILAQKAAWEIKAAQGNHYDNHGKKIQNLTIDPKTILVIGSSEQFSGDDREAEIKAKTFELFRRNSRNIEILTFDELYDKADFIVNHNKEKPAAKIFAAREFDSQSNLDLDDLPF